MLRFIQAASIAASLFIAIPAQAQVKTLRCVLPNGDKPAIQWELSLNESQRQAVKTYPKSGLTSSYRATFTAKDVFFFDEAAGIKINYQLDRTNGVLSVSVNSPMKQIGTCKTVANPSTLF